MWEIIVLIPVLLLLLLIVSWTINYKYWKYIGEIPGPKSYPIIGNLIEIIKNQDNLFYYDRKRFKELYPISKIWSFNVSMVCLQTPEDIELVLLNRKHHKKNNLYNFLHNWLGTGLLTSDGSKWHNRRKILTPAFHFNILQEFIHVFNKETEHLVKILEKECTKSYTNLLQPIAEFTLYSIGGTSLGVDLSKGNNFYKNAVYNMGSLLTKRLTKPWFHNEFLYKLSHMWQQEQKIVKILHEFSTTAITERKKLFTTNGEISYSDRKRLAMLDLMLKAQYGGDNIDDEGIREEVDTFMFEGHDTTAMAICYTLMVLANEERIQDEVLQEIKDVLGNSNKLPTYNELVEMKFMERCIKESLRLFPSVPFIGRVAGEDLKTHSGYTIPKGCDINIYIFDLHRLPQYWENPEKFDPDRFLPENIVKQHPFAYLPFSAGSRNCIGQKFAILEIKTVLCGILRRFKLKPVDTLENIKFKSDLVLRPLDEVRVKFVLRE